jgi:DNA-directed RNA polymerase specialized sigma24 family protein
VNHLRKLKRSRLVLTEELAPLEEPAPVDRPSQTISKKETWTRVIQIIRGFREPDRTILTKRILESKPFNDIARLLGQPVDTVKSIYYRTTAELREKAGFAGP